MRAGINVLNYRRKIYVFVFFKKHTFISLSGDFKHICRWCKRNKYLSVISLNAKTFLLFQGQLKVVDPIQACTALKHVGPSNETFFALVERSPDHDTKNCSFSEKVLNVQRAGYGVAIVFNDRGGGSDIFPMTGKERKYY